MESLYRKYRPQTFDDVVGQKHVVSTLRRAVLEGRISHAYLFCGPRGTGKTTMARLLAKALLCEEGPGRLPDGTCEECRLIASGEHPDVYELDAASNTGVDNVREEIINRVAFAPVRGGYKVYIIDEVHMLTTAAFNALLKTLEEPPSHVVFVLCTTDPQKVLETILSRVQRFDFHSISNEELLARLVYVCEQEGFSYDKRALELVARHARGGMRDALTKLEQLATATGGQVSVAAAQALLGEVPVATLSDVSMALANRDVSALFSEAAVLSEEGRDLLQFVHELAARLRDAYVVSAVGARPGIIDATGDDLQRIADEAKAFGSPERLSRALAVLADASTEMRVATNQRLVLELAFARLAHPEADITMDSLAERIAVLEQKVAELESAPRVMAPTAAQAPVDAQAPAVTQAPTAGQTPARTQAPSQPQGGAANVRATAPAEAVRRAAAPETLGGRGEQVPSTQQSDPQATRRSASAPAPGVPQGGDPAQRATSQQDAVPATGQPGQQGGTSPANTAVTDPGDLQRRWKRVCDELLAAAPARGSLLMQSTIVSDDGSSLVVSLPKGSAFACKMLERPDVRDAIEPAVRRAFGPRRVLYTEGDAGASYGAGAKAPATQRQATQATQPRQAPPATQDQVPAQSQSTPPVATRQPAQASAPASRQATQAPAAMAQQQAQASAPVRPATSQANAAPAPSQGSGYLAPWDDDVPPYDEVPYSEADAAYYAEEGWDDPYAQAVPAAPVRQAVPAKQAAPATPVRQTAPTAPAPTKGASAVSAPGTSAPAAPATASASAQGDPAVAQAASTATAAQPIAAWPSVAAPTTAPQAQPTPGTPTSDSPAGQAVEAEAKPQERVSRQFETPFGTIDEGKLMDILNDVFGESTIRHEPAPEKGEELLEELASEETAFIDEPVDDEDYEG